MSLHMVCRRGARPPPSDVVLDVKFLHRVDEEAFH